MKTKYIKLINNERINQKVISSKACDATSDDVCFVENHDYAECTVNSFDECYKDYAGCFENGYDSCNTDYATCSGIESWDKCTTDYDAN